MPKRIQLRRTKGWRKPPEAKTVSRPTKWGNPFKVGDRLAACGVGILLDAGLFEVVKNDHDHQINIAEALALYRAYIIGKNRENPDYYDFGQLTGRDLACWCPLDQPCHADVLLGIANG